MVKQGLSLYGEEEFKITQKLVTLEPRIKTKDIEDMHNVAESLHPSAFSGKATLRTGFVCLLTSMFVAGGKSTALDVLDGIEAKVGRSVYHAAQRAKDSYLQQFRNCPVNLSRKP